MMSHDEALERARALILEDPEDVDLPPDVHAILIGLVAHIDECVSSLENDVVSLRAAITRQEQRTQELVALVDRTLEIF